MPRVAKARFCFFCADDLRAIPRLWEVLLPSIGELGICDGGARLAAQCSVDEVALCLLDLLLFGALCPVRGSSQPDGIGAALEETGWFTSAAAIRSRMPSGCLHSAAELQRSSPACRSARSLPFGGCSGTAGPLVKGRRPCDLHHAHRYPSRRAVLACLDRLDPQPSAIDRIGFLLLRGLCGGARLRRAPSSDQRGALRVAGLRAWQALQLARRCRGCLCRLHVAERTPPRRCDLEGASDARELRSAS